MTGQPRRRKAQQNVAAMLGLLRQRGPMTTGQLIEALGLPDEAATRMACRDLKRYPAVTKDSENRLRYRNFDPGNGR